MNIKYAAILLLFVSSIKAHRSSVFDPDQDEYYDKEETCKKINLSAQDDYIEEILHENIRKRSPRGITMRQLRQLKNAETIKLLVQEIASRDHLIKLFKKSGDDKACQCMEWQKEDLINELKFSAGVREPVAEEEPNLENDVEASKKADTNS